MYIYKNLSTHIFLIFLRVVYTTIGFNSKPKTLSNKRVSIFTTLLKVQDCDGEKCFSPASKLLDNCALPA